MHLFGKKLLIRFTVCVLRDLLSDCAVCRAGVESDCTVIYIYIYIYIYQKDIRNVVFVWGCSYRQQHSLSFSPC